MTDNFVIAHRADLAAARDLRDLREVVVVARRLKYRGLLPLALKYALFAVREGGRIVIDDADDRDTDAFAVPHAMVRAWTFQFLGRDTEVVSLTPKGRIELVRTRPVLPVGWSAGVVFSGRDAEIPTLLRCFDGLVAQPELAAGAITVCGPERDLGFLVGHPQVSYLPYADAPGERVMIAAKKNHLIRHLDGPRVAVLHARVVLEPGALAAVPREFDISGPAVRHAGSGRTASYLSLASTETVVPGRMPRRAPVLMRHVGDDPVALHERGNLFVDGGAFYVTRAAHAACPLNDQVAWNEAEDVEWCARAFVGGLLVDIAPHSRAMSQTSKIRVPPDYGRATPPLLNLLAAVRASKSGFRDALARWRGQR